jgi:hypothetical protein
MAHAIGHLRSRFRDAARARGLRAMWFAAHALLLMLLGPTARGQGTTPAPAVRFTVFAPQPIKDLAFTPRPNAPNQTVQFQSTARSPRYEYRGAMPLRFVDATSGAVVAEANIPAGLRDALLLFTPIEPAAARTPAADAQPPRRYQIAVLDDGAARHNAGGLAIINLSGLTLTGTVNTEKVALKGGLNPTIPVGRSAEIALSTVSQKRTYQAYAGTATLGRNERALLILFPPFYKGAHEVQSRLLLDQPPGVGTGTAPTVAPKVR